MNNSFMSNENENIAQNYYPKALSLGQNGSSQKVGQQPETQSSPLSSLLSSLFSGSNQQSPLPQLSQLLGNNPLLSALLSGNTNQSDLMSKLLGSLSSKKEAEIEKERIIDLSNSIEEL